MHRLVHLVVVALAAATLYIHPKMLNGEFVYDDGGTITGNPVTLGALPFNEVWNKDYWGKDDIWSKESHKSYRPITSITFRWNALYAIEKYGDIQSFGFHVVNVVLHTLVSLLVYPTTIFAFKGNNTIRKQDEYAAFATALMFAVHPVHSESVQNITGRAEVLMSFFFLLGFLSFALAVNHDENKFSKKLSKRLSKMKDQKSTTAFFSLSGVLPNAWMMFTMLVLVPALTLGSFLSKEMGATLPMLCAFWDFFQMSQLSLVHLLKLPLLPFPSCWAINEKKLGETFENKIGGEDREKKETNSLDSGVDDGEKSKRKKKRSGNSSNIGTSNIVDSAKKKGSSMCESLDDNDKVEPDDVGVRLSLDENTRVRYSLSRWLVRTVVMAVMLITLLNWRIKLNGGHTPYFRYNTNRAGIETFKPSWKKYDQELKLYQEAITSQGHISSYSSSMKPPVKPLGYVAPHEVEGSDSGVHGAERWLSIMVVWCHYLQSCILPRPVLSPDWSGDSIPLVRTLNPLEDQRIFKVIVLWIIVVYMVYLGCLPRKVNKDQYPTSFTSFANRLLTCGAFYAFPFMLSANVLVIVGTTVAERVAYLPSLGVAMSFGLFLGSGPFDSFRSPILPFYLLFPFSPSPPLSVDQLTKELQGFKATTLSLSQNKEKEMKDKMLEKSANETQEKEDDDAIEAIDEDDEALVEALQEKWCLGWRSHRGRWVVFTALLLAMVQKCMERNFAWTNQVELWAAAFDVNPRSAHTCHNYGVNLSINNGVRRAVEVLTHAAFMPREERVDADEIYPTLAMCLMASGNLQGALEMVAYGWNEIDLEIDAGRRGIKIYHMHELIPSTARDRLRQGRLLAVQATLLKTLDAKEASTAALIAFQYAGNDPLVRRLITDLENYYGAAYQQQQQFQQRY